MDSVGKSVVLHQHLIDSLYAESMVLADEARAYFDVGGRRERDLLDPMQRVVFSCESLKVTTRLMHVIAWLLTQKAVAAGEISVRDAQAPARLLGDAPVTDAAVLDTMPQGARSLVVASVELYRRVDRIERAQDAPPAASPARAMFERLALTL